MPRLFPFSTTKSPFGQGPTFFLFLPHKRLEADSGAGHSVEPVPVLPLTDDTGLGVALS